MFCNLINWIFFPQGFYTQVQIPEKKKEEEGDFIGGGEVPEGGDKGRINHSLLHWRTPSRLYSVITCGTGLSSQGTKMALVASVLK